MKKNIILLLAQVLLLMFASCTKDEPNNNEPNNPEDNTIEAVGDIVTYSGFERFAVDINIEDKNTSKISIFWDDQKAPYEYSLTSNFDFSKPLNIIVDSLPEQYNGKKVKEGDYTLTIIAYNKSDKASSRKQQSVKVYGSTYCSSLANRLVLSQAYENGTWTITWKEAALENDLGILLNYTSTNGSVQKQFVTNGEINNFQIDTQADSPLFYSTAYRVKSTDIDTLYSDANEISKEQSLVKLVVTNPIKIRSRQAAIATAKFIDPAQRNSCSEWGLCFATTPKPTIDNIKIVANKAEKAVSADGDYGVFVDNLNSETTYYVRAYAVTNKGELTYGEEETFATTKGANITYTLEKAATPTAEQTAAYARIEQAMDSAIYYFDRYCNWTKKLNVKYVPSVNTADASYAGNIRFGEKQQHQKVRTAMHEINHTFGSGTTNIFYNTLTSDDGKYIGEQATIVARVFGNDWTLKINVDKKDKPIHFWPGGLNYDHNVESYLDLVQNALMMEGMKLDGLK